MFVAIHQLNYLPWIGYFRKIAQCDVFVFLDDVPFSKGSFTNRVKVLGSGVERWLSVPVSANLGDKINAIHPAKPNWLNSHMSSLTNYYVGAECFKTAWPKLRDILAQVPNDRLDRINSCLVEAISAELGLTCKFVRSSDHETGDSTGDRRLIDLLTQITPNATYLSGKGAKTYQDPEKYRASGFGFRYSDFDHPRYRQLSDAFVPGLSVVDLILNVGWKQAGQLIKQP